MHALLHCCKRSDSQSKLPLCLAKNSANSRPLVCIVGYSETIVHFRLAPSSVQTPNRAPLFGEVSQRSQPCRTGLQSVHVCGGQTMSYDLIVVGGGVTGSSLASRVASSGARVLVVERETRFRDRIRGEALQPWGVAEARMLGISEVLQATASELLWF